MILSKDCDLIEEGKEDNCLSCYRCDICYPYFNKCNECIRFPAHISKCCNSKGFCISFPYDMGCNNQDMFVRR